MKSKKPFYFSLSLLLVSVLIPLVVAHAPLGTGDNESIDRAMVIPDPTKSWALYSSLNNDGDPQYYTFNITAGQTIHVTLYKSMRNQDINFTPRLIIIGLNIAPQGEIPSKVTVPSGLKAQLVNQTDPTPTFEPFSPGTFTGLADTTINNPAPGKYYLVVFEQSNITAGGNYGLAIGDRETYTIDEWVLIPLNLMSIYQWEGQNIALILTPMIVTLTVGISIVAWRLRKQGDIANPMAWIGAVAGLAFIGTAASTLFQLLFDATKVTVGAEAAITAIFIIIPLILGIVTLRVAIKNSQKTTIRKRIYFLVLGVAALFIWAGLLVGPILAIIAAIMPTSSKRKKQPRNVKKVEQVLSLKSKVSGISLQLRLQSQICGLVLFCFCFKEKIRIVDSMFLAISCLKLDNPLQSRFAVAKVFMMH